MEMTGHTAFEESTEAILQIVCKVLVAVLFACPREDDPK